MRARDRAIGGLNSLSTVSVTSCRASLGQSLTDCTDCDAKFLLRQQRATVRTDPNHPEGSARVQPPACTIPKDPAETYRQSGPAFARVVQPSTTGPSGL